jgi:hypothetical protein
MYRLYARTPDHRRYRPVDWSSGAPVSKAADATLFSEYAAGKLKKLLPLMRFENPGFEFKVLKVRGPA